MPALIIPPGRVCGIDEAGRGPLAGPVVAAAVIELLKELQRELDLSYVFISHDLSTVQAICDEVMVMQHGKVVETLPAGRLATGAQHPYSQLLFASVPKLDTGWLDSLPPRVA